MKEAAPLAPPMSSNFLGPDFLLRGETARRLYHGVAAGLPIYDYHGHLSPTDLAENRCYSNLHEIWLEGDHYKWRAMRAAGIPESHITGSASPYEKYLAWAEVVPQVLGNPLYHWTHLELRRYFQIESLLNPDTAAEIWDESARQLKSLSTWSILERFRVALIATTDDPSTSLDAHRRLAVSSLATRVYPTFRPDRALDLSRPEAFASYLQLLGARHNLAIRRLDDLLLALERSHQAFHDLGSRISDHGLEAIPVEGCGHDEAESIFSNVLEGRTPSPLESRRFLRAMLEHCARIDASHGWTQQFHLGARRNPSTRLMCEFGPDAGGDCIGDEPQGTGLCSFLDALDQVDNLPRTILYNINPRDNYLFATIAGSFQRGPTRGKLQWGSGWWFLDQRDGIRAQLRDLAQLGLLSGFVGMLTDSRSMMSFPRHEYFRRILCDLVGNWVDAGELPWDESLLTNLIEGICFHNAYAYFGMQVGSVFAGTR